MLILSLSGTGEGLSPNFPTLLVSRFLLGLGAALFFAPAIGILTPLFRPEEEGFVLGLYNSCFNIGGALGLFGWVLVTDLLGWRQGLVLGGLIGIISVQIRPISDASRRCPATRPRSSLRLPLHRRNHHYRTRCHAYDTLRRTAKEGAIQDALAVNVHDQQIDLLIFKLSRSIHKGHLWNLSIHLRDHGVSDYVRQHFRGADRRPIV